MVVLTPNLPRALGGSLRWRRPRRLVARSAPARFTGIEPLEPRLMLAADLVVTSITDTASFYSTGNYIQAEAHIANVGSFLSNSGPFDLEFWLSRNNVTSRYRFIESGSVLNVLQGIPTSDIINFPGWQIPTDIPQGTYHITVYLDTGNDVAEENENNNVGKSSNFTIGQPDLEVPSVTVSRTTFGHGDLLGAEATIENTGLGSTLPQAPLGFDLSFYLGTVDGFNKIMHHIEDGSVTFLGGGQSTTDIINLPGWVIPGSVAPGSYRVWVRADSDGDVAESDENNNWGSSQIIQIGLPDLEVPSVTVSRTTFGHGDLLNAEATIENTGLGSTLPQAPLGFDLSFYLGTVDGSNRTMHHIEDGAVTFLGSGQSTTDIINLPGWLIPGSVSPGSYRVWVRADSGGDVTESDEANNWGSSQILQIGLPDLQVPSVDLANPEGVYAFNDLLSAVATIQNTGIGSTLPQAPLGFDVSFYLGAVNATTDQQRMLYDLQDAIVLWLDGDQSTTDNLNHLLLPTGFQAGEYRIWVKADPSNQVVESDENNNWGSSGILTLQGARWEDENGNLLGDSIDEATPVYLAVYTDQVSPASDIPVTIWEDDISFGSAGNDHLEDVTLKHVATPGGRKWQRRWIPYRTEDLVGGVGGDPEYFFRVNNDEHLPGLFDASSNLTVMTNDGEFGVLLVEHTVGTGVPLVLVHGNNSDLAYDLYRWKPMLNRIESHPDDFAEFDVWLWKHDTSKAIGFSGNEGSQADGLAAFIYDDLQVGQPGTQYENAKVALVAHSQGGLVSRSFMNTFNEDLGRAQGEDVSTLITIATPHHGSPFGIEDWAAVLWSQLFGDGPLGEAGFNALRNNYLERDSGTLNLAWSNLDGVVQGAVESFNGWTSTYVLTPRDTNTANNYPDPSVVYLDSLKAQHGTLDALNHNEAFIHKLVAIGAYDNSLADNVTPSDFITELILSGAVSEHQGLSAVTNLLAMMSGDQLGNSNPSNYLANDGLVPLQSALLLDLPASGIAFASLGPGQSVQLDTSLIAAHAPRDMLYHIFSGDDGIADHADVLETGNTAYWTTITQHLRSVLETVPPTAMLLDPVQSASIAAPLLNARGYIDIAFSDLGGSTLDPTSILDPGAEFMVTGAAAAGVLFEGLPVRLEGDDHTYRYAFTGGFLPGPVTLELIPGGFADDAGNLSAPQLLTFNVAVEIPPLGDLDGNGILDAFDVDDFELALTDRSAYAVTHPGLDPDVIGDIDASGQLDAFDVAPFEMLLAGGMTAPASRETPPITEANQVSLFEEPASDSLIVNSQSLRHLLAAANAWQQRQERSESSTSRVRSRALWQHIESLRETNRISQDVPFHHDVLDLA